MIHIFNKHYPNSVDAQEVYIGRGSSLGNPFSHLPVGKSKAIYLVKTRDEAVYKYREWLAGQIKKNNGGVIFSLAGIIEKELNGEDVKLACFCKPKSCHGDVVKEFCLAVIETIKHEYDKNKDMNLKHWVDIPAVGKENVEKYRIDSLIYLGIKREIIEYQWH